MALWLAKTRGGQVIQLHAFSQRDAWNKAKQKSPNQDIVIVQSAKKAHKNYLRARNKLMALGQFRNVYETTFSTTNLEVCK
jgi:basic membrane lipoprotein Med (substrate-binding protein (PBP1-ABC) superfamily)